MRCVERGPWPKDDNCKKKIFAPYKTAKNDLMNKLGDYCCYCERPGDLDIDHVVPVDRQPALEEDWTNFLLACRNCNATKGARNLSRDRYIWPDLDDTESAFEYLPSGGVKVREDLDEPFRAKAQALFDLVGIGRPPWNDPMARDSRWRKRRARWNRAEELRERLANGDTTIDDIVASAKDLGFWSVWMTVFADHCEVRARLRKAFPGTRRRASRSPPNG